MKSESYEDRQCERFECIRFKKNRCSIGLHDKPKGPFPYPPRSCKYFSTSKWYGTKHQVKRARAEGKIPQGEDRDVGLHFHPIHYAARGKKKEALHE